jgi:hypothetical protein
MINNNELTEIGIMNPLPYKNSLPDWGMRVLDYVAPRILVGVDEITRNCFPSGSRKGRKQLVYLSQVRYLKRYELASSDRHYIAYSQGIEGIRKTGIIAPEEINIIKAQELIIANKFCNINNITNFFFKLNSKGLVLGEIQFKGKQYSMWCPRLMEKEKRLKSLLSEIPLSSNGLMVIAPNLKYIYNLADSLKFLYIPVYFAVDFVLDQFTELVNGVLVPALL